MKKIIFLALIAISTYSCKSDDNKSDSSSSEPKTLSIATTYQGASFETEKNYTSPDGQTFRIDNLSTFLSDPTLEFRNDTSYFIKLGETKSIILPFNESNEITFGIGVDSVTNETVTSDYLQTHPLGNPDEYWAIWESYIFTKIEGKIDLDEDGRLEQGFTFHIGMNEFYNELTFPLTDGNLQLELKIDSLLFGNSSSLDFATENLTHTNPLNSSQIELSEKVMTNFTNSLSIR